MSAAASSLATMISISSRARSQFSRLNSMSASGTAAGMWSGV